MRFKIEYSEEKSLMLKQTRGVSFEDVKEAIDKENILNDFKHHDRKKHPNQRILVVRIKDYAYGVPYVVDKKRGINFLKTIYPSRLFTKKYLKI